jgi:hypothetical protein
MDRYHIGTRLRGYPKNYIKALSCEISKKFNLTGLEKKIVPHLTFIAPFETRNEKEVVNIFSRTLSKYSFSKLKFPIIYDIDGFGCFDNQEKVIYANIKSNEFIEEIVSDLKHSLNEQINYCDGNSFNESGINLHCTIVGKDVNPYYKDIMKFLDEQPFEKTKHPLFRVYLLKNSFILREYDFYLEKSLERFDAINPFVFDLTKEKFKAVTNYTINESGIILPKITINL